MTDYEALRQQYDEVVLKAILCPTRQIPDEIQREIDAAQARLKEYCEGKL